MNNFATQVEFNATKLSDIKMVLKENANVVTIISEKEKISISEARQLLEDTIRFLYLCSISDEALSPTEKLDVGWHHFILCTKEYANFCNKYLGRFIHHSPYTAKKKESLTSNPVVSTLLFAKRIFGELSENWSLKQVANLNCNDSGKCCGGGNCSNTGNCSHCEEG